MNQMPAEECAVDIKRRVNIEISFMHHECMGLAIHQRYKALGVATYHFSVAPGNHSGHESHDFNILQGGTPAGKLHRVFCHNGRCVNTCRLFVEKRRYPGRYGDFVHK